MAMCNTGRTSTGNLAINNIIFLSGTTPEQAERFMEIERSPVLTKGEKRAKEDQWAAKQIGPVSVLTN